MAPRGASSTTSTKSAAMPYTRRSSNPKSSRQQFSACGACRMRRVRCDLKDLPIAGAGPNPSCSNCRERGLKCVDEFADVKAVKLLRRGRRLQQVEAIYGKITDDERVAANDAATSTGKYSGTIPHLMPEFFASTFWMWFSVVFPIVDPNEFSARYITHAKDPVHHPLGTEGYILSLLLVVWAVSFGCDQYGNPCHEDGEHADDHASRRPGTGGGLDYPTRESTTGRNRRMRKNAVSQMLKEVLELIDMHGVLRKPSLDGVKVLLLVVPLLNEPNSLEHRALYEAALSQARALSLSETWPGSSDAGRPTDDPVARARTLWFAYVRESITTGMKGGRFILSEDDLKEFQRVMPALSISSIDEGLPSPVSPSFTSVFHRGDFTQLSGLYNSPLLLSAVCRKVHATLTGHKAIQALEQGAIVNPDFIYDIWRELDECWNGFNNILRSGIHFENAATKDQFASAWKICIFECHNVIRESLKPYCASTTQVHGYPPSPSSRPSSQSSNTSESLLFQKLYTIANQKCYQLLPSILRIIQHHLRTSDEGHPGFLQLDAGLVLDGCYYAGILAATCPGEVLGDGSDKYSEGRGAYTPEEGVTLSLKALTEMKWAFSPVEIRQDAVKEAWRNRSDSRYRSCPVSTSHEEYAFQQPHEYTPPYINSRQSVFQFEMLPPPAHGHTYNLHHTPERPNTGQSVAYSDGGWPAYTPPPTGTSVATSGSGLSPHGSPGSYSHIVPASTSSYPADLEQFNFTTHVTPLVSHPPLDVAANFSTTSQTQAHSYPSTNSYLDHEGFAQTTPSPIAEGLPPSSYTGGCEPFYHT